MAKLSMNLNRYSVLLLVVIVSFVFFEMVRGFILTIVMAGLFAGLLQGWYKWFLKLCRGKRLVASGLTLLAFVLIILIPLVFFTAMLVEQAISATTSFEPFLNGTLDTPEMAVAVWLESIPYLSDFLPEEQQLIEAIDNVVRSIGTFMVDGLSKATTGTVNFLFQTFIMLFTMFYFLIDGKNYLKKALYYIPLSNDQEALLLDKFVRVTKATLKGTLIIGAVQGSIAGTAMWVAGVPNTLFWGVIMAVLSVIPALGPAMVWLPAGIILVVQGEYTAGIGLIAFCAVVVSSIDNVIRPSLVGKDAQLPDLMILFGTLGGLAFFGIAGFILGPVIAALFMTAWEIYGNAFQDSLEKVTLFEEPTPPEPVELNTDPEDGPG